jgi:pimeloyl-ACP methyl ester carboxylesterase
MSMGGYGALLAAEREPARYRAVAVAGPAIFPSYADERGSVGDAFTAAAPFVSIATRSVISARHCFS